MDKILLTSPLIETTNPLITSNFSITFENVSFAYQKDTIALNAVSFKSKQGEITALVGASGSGKSTIAHLIPRFFDIDQGSIKIGNVDIRDMSSSYLFSIVSFVFQEVFLFKQSIFDNIRVGDKNANINDVIKAAKLAQCHDFIIKLPKGYDTIIGEEGVHLSGGEQQRIVIARAIIKNAPILVLDEATAFSDPENEQKIQLALSALMKNKTTIIIAHRLATIKNVDQILVIEDGKIAEYGQHKQLLASDGLYSRMWSLSNDAKEWAIRKEAVNV
jgi:ATP-binding cassette subfamily B protein